VDAEGRHVIVEDAEGLATVERIVSLRRAGASLREICKALDEENRRTARGGRWQPGTVAKVLKRSGPQAGTV
jgi:DNA-binding transcriptional MerR regulator